MLAPQMPKDAALLAKLGPAVRARREQLKLTRSQLAGKARIPYSRLSHFELAEDWVTVPVYLRIVLALGGRVTLL